MKKTECMVFGTWQRLASQNSDTIDLNIHGQPIKSTNAFKCLGVVLDSPLSFNDHKEHLRKNLPKILGVFSRARPALTLEAANRVYAAMVLPILDYCDIAVWHETGQGNGKVVERLQRRAARIVYSSTAAELSTDEVITKLGWGPLTKRREATSFLLLGNASKTMYLVIFRITLSYANSGKSES